MHIQSDLMLALTEVVFGSIKRFREIIDTAFEIRHLNWD